MRPRTVLRNLAHPGKIIKRKTTTNKTVKYGNVYQTCAVTAECARVKTGRFSIEIRWHAPCKKMLHILNVVIWCTLREEFLSEEYNSYSNYWLYGYKW